MKTDWRTRNWRLRLFHLVCACWLLPFSTSLHAQAIGTSFWYEPSHDKWVPTEFYAMPALNAPTTRIPRKTRILLVAERQGWFAIRAEIVPGNPTLVFMPVRMFRFRLYRPGPAGDANAAFQRSSLFEIDPDIIQRQLEGKDQEATTGVKTNPTGKLKPWQKYKENWGSLKPPPKKKKYLLLDDIKQPEEAPETPP